MVLRGYSYATALLLVVFGLSAARAYEKDTSILDIFLPQLRAFRQNQFRSLYGRVMTRRNQRALQAEQVNEQNKVVCFCHSGLVYCIIIVFFNDVRYSNSYRVTSRSFITRRFVLLRVGHVYSPRVSRMWV